MMEKHVDVVVEVWDFRYYWVILSLYCKDTEAYIVNEFQHKKTVGTVGRNPPIHSISSRRKTTILLGDPC